MHRLLLTIAIGCLSTSAFASSDDAWKQLYERTEKACLKKSGFTTARVVDKPVLFSKHVLYRIEGVYPQAHMKGQTGTVYCLHPYPKGRAEISEQ